MNNANLKIVLAKPGLDGHDKGIRLVAMALRDYGYNVSYLGLRQQPRVIAQKVAEQTADVVGLSILSGAHLSVCRHTLAEMKKANLSHVPLIVGGVIPEADIQPLKDMGVAEVFPVGSPFADVDSWLKKYQEHQGRIVS